LQGSLRNTACPQNTSPDKVTPNVITPVSETITDTLNLKNN